MKKFKLLKNIDFFKYKNRLYFYYSKLEESVYKLDYY